MWLEGGAEDMLHGRRRLLEYSCGAQCGLFYKIDGRNAVIYGLDKPKSERRRSDGMIYCCILVRCWCF